jgi:hypothetical protein
MCLPKKYLFCICIIIVLKLCLEGRPKYKDLSVQDRVQVNTSETASKWGEPRDVKADQAIATNIFLLEIAVYIFVHGHTNIVWWPVVLVASRA